MVIGLAGPVHRAVRGWRADQPNAPTSRHCSSTGWRCFAALISRQSKSADAIEAAAAAALAALHGVTMGDEPCRAGRGNPGRPAAHALVEGCGLRAWPLRQARGWGHHRMSALGTVLVIDAAPPPPPKMASAGCASTLAFEMSDGSQRLIINCGGPAAPYGPAAGPGRGPSHHGRAQHSIISDTNSTAILPDGSLGKGGGRPHRAQRGQRL